jgi:hypothetical protein
MRERGATSPETNYTAATDPLVTLARLLARQTARECLSQTPALHETSQSAPERPKATTTEKELSASTNNRGLPKAARRPSAARSLAPTAEGSE